ncbi:enoyl-CoA hydratase [Nakamurella silvestris]|nr:enoyl-CoA hydratase [Nakamurella silvestris]
MGEETAAELVHLGIEGPVATITLDAPEKRNALSVPVRRQLAAHLNTALGEETVRVVVLTHTGRVFCSGLDLSEPAGPDGGPSAGLRDLAALITTIWTARTPVVARLSGPARAGGIGLLAACDLGIAAEDAGFAFPEVRIGVIPAVIAVPVLERADRRAAGELMLTGEVFSATRAAEIGLISAAVPATELDAVVGRYVDNLRQAAPEALHQMKSLLNRDISTDLAQAVEISARLFASPEGAEGIASFREKRPPRWAAGPT